MTNLRHLNINDIDAVNALWEKLASDFRQFRTEAEIHADNEAEQRDQDEEEAGTYR